MKQARIEQGGYSETSKGVIEIKYTAIEGTLPLQWQGASLGPFPDRAAFLDAVTGVEERLTLTDLVLLKCAVALKADPTFGDIFVAKVHDGVPVVVDFSGAGVAISL